MADEILTRLQKEVGQQTKELERIESKLDENVAQLRLEIKQLGIDMRKMFKQLGVDMKKMFMQVMIKIDPENTSKAVVESLDEELKTKEVFSASQPKSIRSATLVENLEDSADPMSDLLSLKPDTTMEECHKEGSGYDAMECTMPQNAETEIVTFTPILRKPRILLGACGSVAAIKFAKLCHWFCGWAEVKAVATKASLRFIDRASLPTDVNFYTDEEEWSSWQKIGDNVLHIELCRWADIMVIAPLSANTLGKMAGGLCDNLLTCIVRAWDYSKPLFVAPSMNTLTWSNPFTERHLMSIDEFGACLIPPLVERQASGDYSKGAMAETSVIHSTIRIFLESRPIRRSQ